MRISSARRRVLATTLVPWRVAAVTAGLAAVALLTAACGPNTGTSAAASASPTSSATPASSTPSSAASSPSPSPADSATCADASALRGTLANIPHAVADSSSSALTSDLDAARTELDHLAGASNDRYRAQSGALKSALTSLQNALSADAHGTGSILSVFTAAGHVVTQADTLLSAVGTCPSPSPSPAS